MKGLVDFDRSKAAYCSFYCEENVWQLAKAISECEGEFKGAVLFFLNAGSFVAMKNQVAFENGSIGFWDYHVVLLDSQNQLIYDLDSRLGCPVSAKLYFAETFPDQNELVPEVRAMVRSIPIREYVSRFSSDRSHMVDSDGVAREPFPQWPAIVNDDPVWLDQYRLIEAIDGSASEVFAVEDFARRVAKSSRFKEDPSPPAP